jgi:pimeloyl-ACP methyl ester carboxylesterase
MGGYDQGLILARTAGVPGYRYIAPSRPGYLGTPLSRGRTPVEQADLYRDLLDSLGIERVAVMGISGGGVSALQFALSHPDRCSGLVIISSVCTRNEQRPPLAWYIMKVAARIGPLVAAMKRKAEKDPDRAASRAIPDPLARARTLGDPEIGPLFLELRRSTFDRLPLRLPGTENDIAVTRGELSFPLEQLKAPLLIVHGTKDSSAPFTQAQVLASRVPGAELLPIEGGEHMCIFTDHDAVRARVGRFLGATATACRAEPQGVERPPISGKRS